MSDTSEAGRFTAKVAGGFIAVVLVIGTTALVALDQVADAGNERETAALDYFEDAIHAERLRSAQHAVTAAGRGFQLTGSQEFLALLEDREIAFEAALARLRGRVASGEGRHLLDAVATAAADYSRAQHRAIFMKQERRPAEEVALEVEQQVVPLRRALFAKLDAFVLHKEVRKQRGSSDAHVVASRANATGLGIVALAVVASMLISWSMSRHLARRFRREEAAVAAATRALAERDQVLSIVAHDLRSPLSAITLAANLLVNSTAEDATRKRAESLERIAHRMESLIRSLLDAASIDAGKYIHMEAAHAR